MLQYSLEVMAASELPLTTIVVVPDPAVAEFAAVVNDLSPAIKVDALVPGGPTRQESVRRGLESADPGTDWVICHDAARPLATPVLFSRVLRGLDDAEGSVPVVASADTVKLVRDGQVTGTIPRGEVGLAQTPQGFHFAVLRESHQRALRQGLEVTDDATLVEMAGYRVAVVEGETTNFKITTPADLRRAEHVLADRADLVEGQSR